MNIKMASVPVADPNAAFKFYTEILGFQKYMHMPEMQLAIVVSKDQPKGTTLLLEPIGDTFYKDFQKTAYEKGLPVLVLGSDNVQEEYERLVTLGVKFKKEPTTTEWGILAVFEDTCGNYIQIHQDL